MSFWIGLIVVARYILIPVNNFTLNFQRHFLPSIFFTALSSTISTFDACPRTQALTRSPVCCLGFEAKNQYLRWVAELGKYRYVLSYSTTSVERMRSNTTRWHIWLLCLLYLLAASSIGAHSFQHGAVHLPISYGHSRGPLARRSGPGQIAVGGLGDYQDVCVTLLFTCAPSFDIESL